MPKHTHSFRIVISAFSVVSAALVLSSSLLFAQGEGIEEGETGGQPKERTTMVTATVADREAPSTPILISPADETKFTSNTPTLVWKGSTDNFMVSHYELIFNGDTKFASIPTDATDNTDYTLTYDALTHYYTLVFKSGLGDGSYAWRIVAVDIYDHKSSSVTWDFSIDTTSPSFVITQIEDTEYEISVQDNTNLPTDPIELAENEPELIGTGESNSSVKLTLTFEDGSTETVEFTIDSNGNWNVTLDTLPRDEVIELDFQITDPSGNTSFLSDIKLILRTPKVIVPLPTLPLPGKGPDTEPSKPPHIEIPVIPPIEYIPPPVRDIPKKVVYYVRSYVATVREYYASSLEILMLFSLIPVLLFLPLTKLGILSVYFRNYLSFQLLKDFLWIIGVLRDGKPQGIVVSSVTQEPVSNTLVIYSGKDQQNKPVKIHRLTNNAGIFQETTLPGREFRVSVQHPDFSFPVLTKQPAHLNASTYYLGTAFQAETSGEHPALVIPVEPVKKVQNVGLKGLREGIISLPSLNLSLTTLAICICLAYPSPANLITLGAYVALLMKKKLHRQGKAIDVFVADETAKEKKHVIIISSKPKATLPSEITQTNEHGLARLHLSPPQNLLQIIDFKQKLTEGDNKTTVAIFTDGSTKYLPFIVK